MTTIQKFVTGIVGIAMITTLILPGRQTPAVLNAGRDFATGVLGTAMGTK